MKKSQLPKRTMHLNVETIRELSADKLTVAAGGSGSASGVSTCHSGSKPSHYGNGCSV